MPVDGNVEPVATVVDPYHTSLRYPVVYLFATVLENSSVLPKFHLLDTSAAAVCVTLSCAPPAAMPAIAIVMVDAALALKLNDVLRLEFVRQLPELVASVIATAGFVHDESCATAL